MNIIPEIIPAKHLPLSSGSAQGSTLTAVMFAVVIVACLYFGREVLVPIVLSEPIVRISRNGLPKVPWPEGFPHFAKQQSSSRNNGGPASRSCAFRGSVCSMRLWP
jgi:hypothetical protein